MFAKTRKPKQSKAPNPNASSTVDKKPPPKEAPKETVRESPETPLEAPETHQEPQGEVLQETALGQPEILQEPPTEEMLKERREPLERHLEPPERPVASKRRFPGDSPADALAEETDEQRFKRELVEKAIKGEITQKAAAVAFGVTERQMQRYVMRFRMLGPAGLLRKKSGKPAHNAIPAEIKSKILSVVTSKLTGYRATLVTEHLREFEGVNISKETTRRIMVDNGIYTPGKPHKNIRSSRERRGYRV